MQNKKILIAGSVLVVLVALVAIVANRRASGVGGRSSSDEGVTLPDLTGSEITSFTVHRPDAEPITLTREGETWRITAPIEAEVDANVVRAAVEKLDALEGGDVVARNPSNHERLEVDEAHGVRVVVRVGDDEAADLFLGVTGSGNTMVRPNGQDAVVAAQGSLRHAFDRELSAWRNKRVLDLSPERVQAMRFEVGERTLAFAQPPGEGEWALAEGEPIERFAASRVQAVASTLARLRATDFGAPDVTPSAAGFDAPAAIVTLTIGPEPAPEPEDEEASEAADGGVPEGGAASADDAEDAGVPAPPVTETVVLELGGDAPDDGLVYLRVRGRDTIYTVSSYSADRLRAEVSLFQEPERPAPGEGPEGMGAPPGLPGMPGGHGGPGGGGEIPPELMRQIQEQMRQQGLGAH